MLNDLAVRDPQDVDPAEVHPVMRGCYPHQITLLGALTAPPHRSQRTVTEDRLHPRGQIRKCREVQASQLIQSDYARSLPRQWIVLDVLRRVRPLGQTGGRTRI